MTTIKDGDVALFQYGTSKIRFICKVVLNKKRFDGPLLIVSVNEGLSELFHDQPQVKREFSDRYSVLIVEIDSHRDHLYKILEEGMILVVEGNMGLSVAELGEVKKPVITIEEADVFICKSIEDAKKLLLKVDNIEDWNKIQFIQDKNDNN